MTTINLTRRLLKTTLRYYSTECIDLKAKLACTIIEEQKKIQSFRKQYGGTKVGDVTISMIYGGMRGLTGLVYETSILDPEEGIRFRGYSIPELQKCLPKAPDGKQPLPEGIFWLLLTTCIPTEAEVKWLSGEWNKRSTIPDYVQCLLNILPKNTHPMTQLSAAVTALNNESKFAKAYKDGVKKTQYWEYVYEDAMNLIAKIPILAAQIYKNCYGNREPVCPIDPNLDWSANFSKMMGYDCEDIIEMIRLYLTIHCDHEGGNVTAHTTHLVGSALADPYLSFAAGLNGLAGPLHGLANQEVLKWLIKMKSELGEKPTNKQVADFIHKTLKSGQVIPGYGHAVLRTTDPRYICQREYALEYLPDFPLFKIVSQVYEEAPKILKELGKVANPWPNVDAHSGCLLQYYGLKEVEFYTVMFGVSRSLGVLASLIWDRALGFPLERPKSQTTEALMEQVKKLKK